MAEKWLRFCNECQRKNRHKCLRSFAVTVRDSQPFMLEDDCGRTLYYVEQRRVHSILACAGCSDIHFETKRDFRSARPSDFDEDYPNELEDDSSNDAPEPYCSIDSYPVRGLKLPPPWLDEIKRPRFGIVLKKDTSHSMPDEIRLLLGEVYFALSHRSIRLVAMGIRTIIDLVCNDKIGDIGGFDKKMRALVEGEFLSSRDRDLLTSVVELGHAASHRGHRPSDSDASAALDIILDLIKRFYLHPTVSNTIRERTPHRSKDKS